MYEMMDNSMMWGSGWLGLLLLVVVVFGIAGLAKYLFFSKPQ